MTFTPPDLSEVLTNEQTMNSRLTTCRNDLRAILTKEEIGYTEGDGVIPLIRKLPVPQLASIKVNLVDKFSTGSDLIATVSATDNHGDPMPNAAITVYRLDPDEFTYPNPVSLGTVTTGSNGSVNVNVPMPNDKGYFYVQARNGNISGGDYGVYCTTAINSSDLSWSSAESNLFSANGVGGSSGFEVVGFDDDEPGQDDIVIEAHSGYSGNYFGIKLAALGSYTKSSLEGHKFFMIASDLGNDTKTRFIALGMAFNIDSWSNFALGGAGKYWYGDGTGSAGYVQCFENSSSMSTQTNGNPESPNKKLYVVDCSWAFHPCVIDEYTDDPTVEYPTQFVRHGDWNCSRDGFPSGTCYPSIVFNMPDQYSYRDFRFYGAGVI